MKDLTKIQVDGLVKTEVTVRFNIKKAWSSIRKIFTKKQKT